MRFSVKDLMWALTVAGLLATIHLQDGTIRNLKSTLDRPLWCHFALDNKDGGVDFFSVPWDRAADKVCFRRFGGRTTWSGSYPPPKDAVQVGMRFVDSGDPKE